MVIWSKAPGTPFGAVPERIQLNQDPLVSVVAQVRFDPVLKVRDQDYVASFQEAIRKDYPQAEREMQQQVSLDVKGELVRHDAVLWQFSDTPGNWRVTLSEDFVSLSCSDYTKRPDFIGRLEEALAAVSECIGPENTQRVGVRYTDRLSDPAVLDRLDEYIRPALLGLASSGLSGVQAISELTQAEFITEGVNLRGLWGHLPPDSTHDPLIDPIEEPCWILDLDAYTAEAAPFEAARCAEEAERHAGIVYGFFRWAVSDKFLKEHGAEL